MNLKKNEFIKLFEKKGFKIQYVASVENMPILYKYKFFREIKHKIFNENISRSEGYKLSFIGTALQKLLMRFFPDHVCNIYVLIAKKQL